MGDRIQLQTLHLDHLFGRGGDSAADHRLETGSQLLGREGFGDVIISPDFQTSDLILLFSPRRQHDDGDLAGQLVLFELFDKLDTAATGQHPVQQDQIREGLAYLGNTLLEIRSLNGLESFLLEDKTQHLPDRGFIFNHQYSSRHVSSLYRCSHFCASAIIRRFHDTFMIIHLIPAILPDWHRHPWPRCGSAPRCAPPWSAHGR